jgi:23S rRNA pseudouridine2605 synthase
MMEEEEKKRRPRVTRTEDGPLEERGDSNEQQQDLPSDRPVWQDRTQSQDGVSSYQPRPQWQDRSQDGGGGYQPRRPYQQDGGGGGYQQRRPYQQDGGGGGYQQRPPQDGTGGYQQRPQWQDRNQQDGGGGGYQQRRPYQQYGGGGGYQQRRPYPQDGGGDYQQRRPYQQDGGGGGYQQRPPQDGTGGGYQPRPPQDGTGGGYQPRPPQDGTGGYQQRPQWQDRNQQDGAQGGGYQQRPYGGQGYQQRPYGNQGQGGGGYQQRPYGNQGQGGGGYQQRPYGNQGQGGGGGYQQRPYGNQGQGGGGGYQQRPYGNQGQGGGGGFQQRPFGKPNFKGNQGNKNKKQGFFIPRLPKAAMPTGEGMPLNKYLAHCGVASRRKAVEFIEQGQVTVNGAVIKEPYHRFKLGDIVTCEGKVVQIQERLVYVVLNKPKGVITTTDDEHGRSTVMDIVDPHFPERIYPVGRLDRDTTGLLLLTNDGELAQKLTHPSHHVQKQYRVGLDQGLTREDHDKILAGMDLEDGPVRVNWIRFAEDHPMQDVVELEITMGRNRVVRRIFEEMGYQVKRLDRFYFAGLTKKDLKRGSFRELSQREIIMLKHFTGHPSTGAANMPPEADVEGDIEDMNEEI